MELLLLGSLISLVVSVPDPHFKKIDANGNLHVHLNVPDLGPVEHVNLNKPTQAWETGNRMGTENRAGAVNKNFKLDQMDGLMESNHEDYCKFFPHIDICQEPTAKPSSKSTSKSSTKKSTTKKTKKVVCFDTSKDVCACGQPSCDQNRISGGGIATPHQYPWIVRLVGGCSKVLCGGSLVSPRVILSAFHCTDKYAYGPCDVKRLAVFGRHEFNEYHLSSYYTIPVNEVFSPAHAPLYSHDYRTHDFALLFLQHPAKYSSKVSPICLPEPNAEFGGLKATAAGWGRTDKPSVSREQSPVLKAVELTVNKKEFRHSKMFGTILSKKGNQYQDPCSGDSGGPLMYYNETTSRHVLVGTVQGQGYDCVNDRTLTFEDSDNGMWNKVSAHMEWIQETMKRLGEKVCKA